MGARLRDKEEGVQSFLQTKRRGVTLVTEGRFETTYVTTKQLRSEIGKLLIVIIVRRALREVGLGAQVQQRKPLMGRKHALACLKFA